MLRQINPPRNVRVSPVVFEWVVGILDRCSIRGGSGKLNCYSCPRFDECLSLFNSLAGRVALRKIHQRERDEDENGNRAHGKEESCISL